MIKIPTNHQRPSLGQLTFNTSSSVKYTCIKIRFVGLVATKLAKTSEEVYVLNQQAVVLGNPNNAEEFTLPEGKHSWPFEFALPLQHIPSSGKVSFSWPRFSFVSQHKNNNTAIHQTKTPRLHLSHITEFGAHCSWCLHQNRNSAKELKQHLPTAHYDHRSFLSLTFSYA